MMAVQHFTHPEIPSIDTQYIASLFARPSPPQTQSLPVPNQTAEIPLPSPSPVAVVSQTILAVPTTPPTPTMPPRVIDFVANSSVGEQKALLRSNGFTEVSASVFYKNDGVVEEIILPPAVQYGSSTTTGDDGGEVTLLSPL